MKTHEDILVQRYIMRRLVKNRHKLRWSTIERQSGVGAENLKEQLKEKIEHKTISWWPAQLMQHSSGHNHGEGNTKAGNVYPVVSNSPYGNATAASTNVFTASITCSKCEQTQ